MSLILLAGESQLLLASESQLEKVVTQAFRQTHQGWSVDELLLQDSLRQDFLAACESLKNEELQATEAQLCEQLLQLRKRGGVLPKSTQRASSTKSSANAQDRLGRVAEIAARRLSDELGLDTDALLTTANARAVFDRRAQTLAPDLKIYSVRKKALQLRKAGKLKPELLVRVTDWRREFVDGTVKELQEQPDLIPNRPGIYIFYDTTGYLYIGQASDLRERLATHLVSSDRKRLSQYLESTPSKSVHLEVHVFQPNSPGEALRVRRAYESELIRTRQPRLNTAP